MKKVILISILFLALIECEKQNEIEYSKSLYGKWSWVLSCPGSLYTSKDCWAPNSKYPAYTITFDSKLNYSVSQNDTLIATDKFQVIKYLSDNGKDTVHIINFESGHYDMYSISHDTLHMTNSEGIVTITSHYKRIK